MGQTCRECRSSSIINDRVNGDCTCTSCGLVQAKIIDTENEEGRNFEAKHSSAGGKEDHSRTSRINESSGPLLSVKGDRNPNSTKVELIHHLSSANKATISYNEQKITDGRKAISNFCENLSLLPNVKARSIEIWNQFERSRKKYSRTGDKSMYLAIIYKACKDKGCSRTFKEIALSTGGDHKQITRSYKRLAKNMKEQEETQTSKKPTRGVKRDKSAEAADTIPRFAANLNLPPLIISTAKKITKYAAPYLEGKHPSTIAAASLLFTIRHQLLPNVDITTVANIKSIPDTIKDKEIADAASIAPGTLRTAFKSLEEHSNAIIQLFENSK